MTDLAAELAQWLYPDDEMQIPVPGFPSMEPLVAWAKANQGDELRRLLIYELMEGTFAQQYATMGILRALGVEVVGVGYWEDFEWHVQWPVGPGLPVQVIKPRQSEKRPPL